MEKSLNLGKLIEESRAELGEIENFTGDENGENITARIMDFCDLIQENEEKLSSLRRSLLEIDEMIGYKDESINFLQGKISTLEAKIDENGPKNAEKDEKSANLKVSQNSIKTEKSQNSVITNPENIETKIADLYEELKLTANNLEEYLDLKEAALSQISELEILVDKNRTMFKDYIKTNILDIFTKLVTKLDVLRSQNVQKSSEIDRQTEKILQLQYELE